MPSTKLSLLVSLGANQVPTDLFYIDDLSAGAAGSKSITLNDVFSLITRNITDGAVRFAGVAAPAVSAASQGAFFYSSGSQQFQISENGGAFVPVGNVRGAISSTDKAIVRFIGLSGRSIQDSAITLSDGGALTFPDDIRQTFNPGANQAGLNVGALAGDPGTPVNGDLWYDSVANLLRARINGASITVGNVTGPAVAIDEALARYDGATGKLIQNAAVTLSDAGAFTFPDGVRQTFNPDATTPGLNVGSQAGDPSTPINGDLWYDSTGNLLRARINSATVSLGAGGGGTPGGADTQVQFNNAGAFGGVSGFTSNGTNVTAGSGNLRATRPQFTTSIDDSNGNEVFVITATGSAVNEFTVANAATGGSPTISASGGDANIPITITPKGTGRLESTGPLRLSGTGTDTFTTPASASVPTKINIPLFSPGSFGQILAFGLNSSAPDSARVLSLFDQRSSSGHQPTIQIFNPNEDALFGLTWGGSNAVAQVTTDQILQLSAIRVFIKMPATAPTDADIPNSYLSIYTDETANNLIFRVRDSGGTLQTATLALT